MEKTNKTKSPLKKIAIIGPESTGKTVLAQQLATNFNGVFCPEFARSFLTEHGKNYSFDDLATIAHGQLKLEDEAIEQAAAQGLDYVFFDTTMHVMQVWCQVVFGKVHEFINNEAATRKYHLLFYTKPDVPWVKDDLREYPDFETRNKLYHMYKNIASNSGMPHAEVNGNYNERFDNAVAAIKALGGS
jgi:NadR type nicotinamide-nucleotide adenylyltransferase